MMPKDLKWIDASEKEIENAVLTYLNFQVGCFAFKVNTMGVYDQRGGFYRKTSKFVIAGTPDVMACFSVDGIGVFIGFEIKSPTGRQSKEQKAFQEKLTERSNGFYFLIRSVKEVEYALQFVKKTLRDKKGEVSCVSTNSSEWEQ